MQELRGHISTIIEASRCGLRMDVEIDWDSGGAGGGRGESGVHRSNGDYREEPDGILFLFGRWPRLGAMECHTGSVACYPISPTSYVDGLST